MRLLVLFTLLFAGASARYHGYDFEDEGDIVWKEDDRLEAVQPLEEVEDVEVGDAIEEETFADPDAPPSPSITSLAERVNKRNKLLTTIPKLSPSYSVKFEYKPTRFQRGWTNVIHLTSTGGNCCKYGDRVPAVWFWSSSSAATKNRLHICSAVNGRGNMCYNSGPVVKKGEWTTVEITQLPEGDYYKYSVKVGGNVIGSVVNKIVVQFPNVKVYSAGPWHRAAQGQIRNLIIDPNAKEETDKPEEETEKPKEETEKPKEETEKPKEETEKPKEETEKPKEETEKPKEETEKPKEETEKPKEETEKPKEETEKPKEETEKPKEETEKPNEGPPDLSACVVDANLYRAIHEDTPPLVEDPVLSAAAQVWAKRMVEVGIAHDPDRGFVGENIAWGGRFSSLVDECTGANALWYSEMKKHSMNPLNPKVSGTGHYAAMVWKQSLKVGYGVYQAVVEGKHKWAVVARYSPPGNWREDWRRNENLMPCKSEATAPEGTIIHPGGCDDCQKACYPAHFDAWAQRARRTRGWEY